MDAKIYLLWFRVLYVWFDGTQHFKLYIGTFIQTDSTWIYCAMHTFEHPLFVYSPNHGRGLSPGEILELLRTLGFDCCGIHPECGHRSPYPPVDSEFIHGQLLTS